MIYADTSFLIASRIRRDTNHAIALDFLLAEQDRAWLWSPWHRVEVFNTVRQLVRHPDAKRRLSEAEAKSIIHRLNADVRLGNLVHVEADWRDVLRTANEISVANGSTLACRAADLLHVAYALELSSEWFVTFDEDQEHLAKAAGLETRNPAKR